MGEQTDRDAQKDSKSSLQKIMRRIVHDLGRVEVMTVSETVKAKIAAQRESLAHLLQENQGSLSKFMRQELLHQGTLVTQAIRNQHMKFKGHLRKAVTGDEKKRVRDHVSEKRKEPYFVRLFDKVAFTIGVLNIALCEYFLVSRPQSFPSFYVVIMSLLLLVRVHRFKRMKYQYFMLDFCYYTQALCVLFIYFLSWSNIFAKVVFVFANGPLSWAVPVWRNSLVFHDIDKLTTVYIHTLPNMLSYCMRWYTHKPVHSESMIGWADMGVAVLGYCLWQLLYYLKTEINDKAKLDADPEIQTSLRFLTHDHKNPMHRLVISLMKKIGIMRRDEPFNPNTLKTKLIFMCSQLVYTIMTFLPIPLLYTNETVHLSFVVFIFCIAVYNGASFYIEVFSRRYMEQFEQKREMQAVAEAAAQIVLTAATANKAQAHVPREPHISENSSLQDETHTQGLPTPVPTPDMVAEASHSSEPMQLSENTKRMIQAATSEMIDRLIEERDEHMMFGMPPTLLEAAEAATDDVMNDVMTALGLDYSMPQSETNSSQGSLASTDEAAAEAAAASLRTSTSCPDLTQHAILAETGDALPMRRGTTDDNERQGHIRRRNPHLHKSSIV